jgi:putative Ca2+/H+ antiporter (TMEM165/GDT1 family)
LFALLLLAYGAVFAAEIVGDKLLYTTGVLATRYRAMPIVIGTTAAFIVKMGVAVVAGEALSNLPPVLIAAISAASFLWLARMLWRHDEQQQARPANDRATGGALVSFAAIVFSEWGDIGQITAAALTAQFGSPLTIWIAAVAAMVTKAVLAVSCGAGIRGWIQTRISLQQLRFVTMIFLLVLGILSAFEILTKTH